MKRLFLFLLLFSSLVLAAVDSDNPYLYMVGTSSDKSRLHTRPYFWFESTIKVGADSKVLDAAGGSASNLGNGATICEGTVDITGSSRGEWAHNNNLYAYSPWTGTSEGCIPDIPYTTVKEHDIYWSDALYATFSGQQQCVQGLSCWGQEGGLYYERVNKYEPISGTTYSNMRGAMTTICEGEQYLKYQKGTYYGAISHNNPGGNIASSNFAVTPGTYIFSNALAVTGCSHIVRQNPNCNKREHLFSRTSTGSNAPEYSNYLASSITINVVPEENVGVIAPRVLFAEFPSAPSEIYAGTELNVRLGMAIPASSSAFQPLEFEFRAPSASIPSLGRSLVFKGITGINQCPNGFKNLPNVYQSKDIRGTIEIPEGLSPGTYTVLFRVPWYSCSGETDCNGAIQRGYSDIYIDLVIVEEYVPLPDLVCSISPAAYFDGVPPDSSGTLAIGQGVEKWKLTITNKGDAPAVIQNSNQLMCSASLFNAFYTESGGSVFPGDGNLYQFPYTGYTIPVGGSVTIDINDAPTSKCISAVSPDNYVVAGALANLWLYFINPTACPWAAAVLESDYENNWCMYSIPCRDEIYPTPRDCRIIPTPQSGYPGSTHEFDLLCSEDSWATSHPCEGRWTVLSGGEFLGWFKPSSGKATWASTLISPDNYGDGTVKIRAIVQEKGYAEAVCTAQVVLPSLDCADLI